MAVGIGASGIMGVALETVPGTYLAPTKFFPFRSETLMYREDKVVRRPIRNSADVIGLVPGNTRVEGDVDVEALSDVVPYFHHCSRATVVKTGAVAPFTYAYTPSSAATPPNKTMSITIVRNGVVFGYSGVVVTSFRYTLDNAMLVSTFSMVGRDEAVQTLPVAVWPTTTPFSAGMYSIEIPTGVPVLDTDMFTFAVDDNGSPAYRLRSGGRGAAFIVYGERNATFQVERDFQDRTDYDAFKVSTAQSITLSVTKSAAESITLLMPVAVKQTYEVALGGQANLVRATIHYVGTPNAAGAGYTLTVVSAESIT